MDLRGIIVNHTQFIIVFNLLLYLIRDRIKLLPFSSSMEFVEEESRPRFLLQSRPSSASSSPKTLKPDKLHLLLCFSSASLLLFLTFSFLLESQTLSFLLIWTSLSLLLAPFAPSSVTGGDPRVGRGDPLPPPESSPSDSDSDSKRIPNRRIRSRRPDNPPPVPTRSQDPAPKSDPEPDPVEVEVEESEWRDEDFEILKKQISKHPVGEPKRWEKIAEAFQGRHKLESVIRIGKSLSERRPDDRDSFAQFLKQRKPLDQRVVENLDENGGRRWSSNEDIALLNALKAFPKEVGMRWEKVAAAVPGRSKAECVKRVAELKKDFRSSKASES